PLVTRDRAPDRRGLSALSAFASPIGDTKPCGWRRAAHYRFFGHRCRAYGVCPPPRARRWSRPADTNGDEIAGVGREGGGTRARCHAPIWGCSYDRESSVSNRSCFEESRRRVSAHHIGKNSSRVLAVHAP